MIASMGRKKEKKERGKEYYYSYVCVFCCLCLFYQRCGALGTRCSFAAGDFIEVVVACIVVGDGFDVIFGASSVYY